MIKGNLREFKWIFSKFSIFFNRKKDTKLIKITDLTSNYVALWQQRQDLHSALFYLWMNM